MTKNRGPDQYSYFGYDVGCDSHEFFSFSNCDGCGKNVIIFGVDNSSYLHADNRKKDIFFLGKNPLDDIAITPESEWSVNFNEQQKKFCLSLQWK